MNITDPIRRYARITPSATAIVREDGVTLSYRELDRMLDFLATRALELGVAAGNAVVVKLADPHKFLLFTLALARVGAAGTPDVIAGARMDLCVGEGALPLDLSMRSVQLDPSWWPSTFTDLRVRPVAIHHGGAELCRIFPSSGTTGTPKYIGVSHDLMVRRITSKWLATRQPDGARHICHIGVGTHYGFFTRLRVLWTGGQIVTVNKGEHILPAIHQHRVNALVIAPVTLQLVVSSIPAGSSPVQSLEVIEVGGSLLPQRLFELTAQRLCGNVVSNYGTTETASIASAPLAVLYAHPGAVGYVNPGVEVEAVDANDKPLPKGAEGTLRVRSGNCVDNYVGNPTESAKVFRGGWVYAGDVGSVSATGLLSVSGRATEVINNGGNKVSPHVIEEVLLSSDQVSEAAAFGVPDAMGVVQIWAAIVAKGTVDATALHAMCIDRLKDKTPSRVMQLARLPRNDAGKVLREELKRLALMEIERDAGNSGRPPGVTIQ